MPVSHGIASFVLQASELTAHDVHWAMIFLGIIAISLLLAAVALTIGGFFAYKLFLRVDGIATIVEKKTGPILDHTTQILTDLTPKIQSFSENAEQISYTMRAKVDELGATVTQINQTVQEINGRSRIQIARADGIVTEALVATEEIVVSVGQSIKTPVRQIAALIAGVKAGVETLIARSPFGRG